MKPKPNQHVKSISRVPTQTNKKGSWAEAGAEGAALSRQQMSRCGNLLHSGPWGREEAEDKDQGPREKFKIQTRHDAVCLQSQHLGY